MKLLLTYLVSGFLMSVTPSTVVKDKCINQSPVVNQEKCDEKPQDAPAAPAQEPANGSDNKQPDNNKQVNKGNCPQASAC